MLKNRLFTATVLALILASTISLSPQKAQVPDRADTAVLNRIWEEGINRSQVMTTLSYLADVIGPRIPGSPAMKKALDWATATFSKWGMANVAIEPAGEFGLGWSNEYTSVHLVEPAYQPILAYPVPWTSGTKGKFLAGGL
jgi:carboxypeptidase Q